MKKESDKTTKANGTNRTNGKKPLDSARGKPARGVMIQMQFNLQRG